MKQTSFVTPLVVVVLIVLAAFLVFRHESKPSIYEDFAQCITDSGAIFYGAATCPVCTRQKQLFGKAQSLLPYIECSQQYGDQESIAQCQEAGVDATPYWVFPEVEEPEDFMTLNELAIATGCGLPAEHISEEESAIESIEATPLPLGETVEQDA